MTSCFDKNKTYLIFGTGITGKAGMEFCKKNNLKYYITDDNTENLKTLKIDNNNIEEQNKIYSYNEDILKSKTIDYLLLSPSIHAQHDKHKIVKIAEKLNIEIIPDIDLFYCYLQEYNKKHNTNKKIIAITGTNGKSTTTSLMAYILNHFDKKAIACGNIGLNTLLIDIEKYDYFVAEMSSYNLFLMQYCKFELSILLNITEDHISYHGNIENYAKAKEKSILNSKIGIICTDDEYTKQIVKNNDNIIQVSLNNKNDEYYYDNNKFYEKNIKIFEGEFDNLIGLHNIQNIFCSFVGAKYILKNEIGNNKISNQDIFDAIKSFKGLPHRNQFIKNVDGIDFYNDSKGTNADSTQKALQSFKNRPIYLIAGGQRKTAGFYFLKNDLNNVKKVFLIGEAMDSFSKELDDLKIKYEKCKTLDNAVKQSFIEAKKENQNRPIILLSPLCASWDQYKSFEERGDDFIKKVEKLK